MKDYAIYKKKGEITLILFNGDVYTIKDESTFVKEDGELDVKTPYAHLGKKITIKEIRPMFLNHQLITLINL